MEIRASAAADAEGFRRVLDFVARERLYLAFLEAPPVDSVRAFIESIASSTSVQLLGVDSDRIVGWCDIIANPIEGFRHSGRLGMGLLPAYRGKGLGRRLLQTTLSRAVENGLTRVELEVFAGNAQAIALYEAFGFQHEGVKISARVLDGRSEDIRCMAWMKTPASDE